jgi:hypothetical protein
LLTPTPSPKVRLALPYKLISPLPVIPRFVLPVAKVAVVVPVPAVPMMLMAPSFSRYWSPTNWLAETVSPVKVQLLEVAPVTAVKSLVALTKI